MADDSENREELAPAAIPVERETLQKARLELQDLPVARSVRGFARSDKPSGQSSGQAVVEKKELAEVEEKRTPEKKVQEKPQRTPAFQQPPVEKGSSINRKALESTNRGVKPSSRRFVRGILHPSPFKVVLAAFFAIVVRVALLGAIVLGVLILLEKVDPSTAWFLLILPVAALFYLVTVGQARCRVCGQKEFMPSGALKHVKTHRFLFLGPIISTALHLLIFKWFHCMFCGTAVRIKK